MTMDRTSRVDRRLPGLFDELADARTPDYLEAAIERASSRPQRPAWTFPGRWLPMDITTSRVATPGVPWRAIAALIITALLIMTAVAVYVGSQSRLPQPFGLARTGLVPFERNGDIYTGDPSSGTTSAVLTGPTYDTEPVFSRDGSKIAFRRRVDPADDAAWRLVVMNTDGSDLRVVTPDPIKDAHWWDWTPDGRSLYVIGPESGARTFTTYDLAGAAPPRVLVDTIRDGMTIDVPAFRPPDGGEIMFRGMEQGKVGIWVMAADGTDLRPLVPPSITYNPDYSLREPQYSPDGSQIAFPEWDDATQTMRLYVMRADGTDRRELGADPGIWLTSWPVWSNDGTRLAVQRGKRTTDSSQNGDLPYAIIDVATGAITETGPTPGCCRIAWAPDDSSILLQQEINGASKQWLLDPAGGPGKALPWPEDSWPNWQRLAPD